MKRLEITLAALASVLIVAAQASAAPDPTHGVYTMTNSLAGNAALAFSRAADGSLTPAGTFPTGAIGGALRSGHAIVSRDGHDVVAVTAGSNSITAFEAQHDSLHPIATFPSGGVRPTSVTIDEDVVYVLNAGPLSIAGMAGASSYDVANSGTLTPNGAGVRSGQAASCWLEARAAWEETRREPVAV